MKKKNFSMKMGKRLGAVAMAIALSTLTFCSDTYIAQAEELSSESEQAGETESDSPETKTESKEPKTESGENKTDTTGSNAGTGENKTDATGTNTGTGENKTDATGSNTGTGNLQTDAAGNVTSNALLSAGETPFANDALDGEVTSDGENDIMLTAEGDEVEDGYIKLENRPDVSCSYKETTPADYINDRGNANKRTYELTFTLGADAQGDQTLDIGALAVECLSQLIDVMPGNSYSFDIVVKTADGLKHTYQYKDGSLEVSTPSLDEYYIYDEDGNTLNVTDFTTSGGQKLPINFIPALSKSKPIQKLLGVNSSGLVSFDKVKELYNILADSNNYAHTSFTGETALTDYVVWYYNHYDAAGRELTEEKNYTSITDMMKSEPSLIRELQGGNANAQYTISEAQFQELLNHPQYKDYIYVTQHDEAKGTYTLQIKWPENDLAASAYNQFYNDLFLVNYGNLDFDTFGKYVNSVLGIDPGVGDYSKDVTNEIYNNANEYFKTLLALGFDADEQEKAIQMYIGFNGPLIKNAYQLYEVSYENTITLEQVDGGITIEKTDADGNLITSSPANFQLYYVTMNDDSTSTTWYYTQDADGNVSFTTDLSQASILVTVDGVVGVQYLLPNEYFIQEILAPDGYSINPEAVSVLVKSGQIAVVSLPNSLLPPSPGPTPDPTPGGGGGGGGGGTTPTATTAVLGATRALPDEAVPLAAGLPTDEPSVLGERRNIQTGDQNAAILLMLIALSAGAASMLAFMRKKSS